MKSKWSQEEIDILFLYYPSEGADVILRLSNKTGNEIKSMLSKLDISCPTNESVKIESRWSKEEVALLEKYYPIEGICVKSRLPGRSEGAITGKAAALGLRKDTYAPRASIRHVRAKKESTDKILELYDKGHGPAEISKTLGIKRSAVQSRVAKYRTGNRHVAASKKWSKEDEDLVREYYPTEGSAVAARLSTKRTPGAINTRAERLGVQYVGMFSRVLNIQSTEARGEEDGHASRWSDKEKNIIRKWYPIEGSAVVLRLKDRTRKSVFQMARRLGVRYARSY